MDRFEARQLEQPFEDTGRTLPVHGVQRPVLRLGTRLYVGDTLSVMNPHGYGGRVWSASTEEKLLLAANFDRPVKECSCGLCDKARREAKRGSRH